MFGKTIDYYLLRPFTHSRNRATEEELNAKAQSEPHADDDYIVKRLEKLIARYDGHFPVNKDLRYLDVGCGNGDIAIALARLGARDITGIDILDRNITTAHYRASQLETDHNLKFICGDIHSWEPPHRFDVVMSHEALEHIHDPKTFLQILSRLTEPGGAAYLAFGPLFHSPFGDHMHAFFKVELPWRGVVFNDQAILRLREEQFRPGDPATRFQDIAGGMNLMKYSRFLKYIDDTGWDIQFVSVNPQFKKFGPLYHLSNLLVRIPGLRNYIAASVYVKLCVKE